MLVEQYQSTYYILEMFKVSLNRVRQETIQRRIYM